MITLWTGFKQQHSAFDETIGRNEEDTHGRILKANLSWSLT